MLTGVGVDQIRELGFPSEPHEFVPAERALVVAVLAVVSERAALWPVGARRRERRLAYARVDFLRDRDGALALNELELVEPSLFFRHAPWAAERLARAVVERLR